MGRPIDADALKELFSEVIGRIAIKPEMNGNLEHMIRASAMVIQMIDDAPTVQLGTNLAEVGTDLVSRQGAIDALTERFKRVPTNAIIAKDTIQNLPSAQPERKTGRWIKDRSGAYCCSKCMEPCASYVMMKPRDKYCKMCGSRNEVME